MDESEAETGDQPQRTPGEERTTSDMAGGQSNAVTKFLLEHDLPYANACEEQGWDSLPELRKVAGSEDKNWQAFVTSVKMKAGHASRLRSALRASEPNGPDTGSSSGSFPDEGGEPDPAQPEAAATDSVGILLRNASKPTRWYPDVAAASNSWEDRMNQKVSGDPCTQHVQLQRKAPFVEQSQDSQDTGCVLTFGNLFRDFVFSIPYYQRAYSWQEKECGDLWIDLTRLLSADKEDPRFQTHYLGPISLHVRERGIKDLWGNPPQMGGKEVQNRIRSCCDIVDGQQRLTSIMLLLSCIGRAALAIGKSWQDNPALLKSAELLRYDIIGSVFLVQGSVEQSKQTVRRLEHALDDLCDTPNIVTSFLYRILLSEENVIGSRIVRDCKCVEKLQLQARDGTRDDQAEVEVLALQAINRMQEAAIFFEGKISDDLLKARSEKGCEKGLKLLWELKELIMKKLSVCVFLSVHEHRCAAVFDSLNNRGRKLSQLDLVKSLIYHMAMQVAGSERVHRLLQVVWHDIYKCMSLYGLGQSMEEPLLRMHYLLAWAYNFSEQGLASFQRNAKDGLISNLLRDGCEPRALNRFDEEDVEDDEDERPRRAAAVDADARIEATINAGGVLPDHIPSFFKVNGGPKFLEQQLIYYLQTLWRVALVVLPLHAPEPMPPLIRKGFGEKSSTTGWSVAQLEARELLECLHAQRGGLQGLEPLLVGLALQSKVVPAEAYLAVMHQYNVFFFRGVSALCRLTGRPTKVGIKETGLSQKLKSKLYLYGAQTASPESFVNQHDERLLEKMPRLAYVRAGHEQRTILKAITELCGLLQGLMDEGFSVAGVKGSRSDPTMLLISKNVIGVIQEKREEIIRTSKKDPVASFKPSHTIKGENISNQTGGGDNWSGPLRAVLFAYECTLIRSPSKPCHLNRGKTFAIDKATFDELDSEQIATWRRRLEQYYRRSTKDGDSLEIEHILAANSYADTDRGRSLRAHFGIGEDFDGRNAAFHRSEYQPGNLMLISRSRNGKASDKTPLDKIQNIYSEEDTDNSPQSMAELELIGFNVGNFNLQKIQERSERLAAFVDRNFPCDLAQHWRARELEDQLERFKFVDGPQVCVNSEDQKKVQTVLQDAGFKNATSLGNKLKKKNYSDWSVILEYSEKEIEELCVDCHLLGEDKRKFVALWKGGKSAPPTPEAGASRENHDLGTQERSRKRRKARHGDVV